MNGAEQEIVQYKVRRAVAINALHRIGRIVATELQADSDKAKLLHWLARYGLIVLAGTALLAAHAMGLI